MTDEVLNELAMKVAARLQGGQVSRWIPAKVQDDLAEWTGGRGTNGQLMPVYAGQNMLMMLIKVDADGSITLELADEQNRNFWKVHLEKPPASDRV